MEELIRQVQEAGGPLKLFSADAGVMVHAEEGLAPLEGAQGQDTLAGVLRRDLINRGYYVTHTHYPTTSNNTNPHRVEVGGYEKVDVFARGQNVLEAMLRLWLAVKEVQSGS